MAGAETQFTVTVTLDEGSFDSVRHRDGIERVAVSLVTDTPAAEGM